MAIILFILLAAFFGLTWAMNAKTPLPEGCEKLKEDCSGCQIMDCVHRKEK